VDKKIAMIAAIVAAIAIIAVAAVLLMNNNGNNDSGDDEISYEGFNVSKTRNLVFGNANNDNYLNDEDLKMIKSIVNKELVWDNVNYPLADTNADGVVDNKDVALLEKLLAGEKTTAYYMNWYKDVASVYFPVTGPITVDYSTAYDMCVILGVLDDLVGTRDAATLIPNYNPILYPGLSSHIVSISNDAGVMDPVRIYETGSKLVIGDPYDATAELTSALKRMDPNINVMQLPVNRVMNGIDYTHTIITLGVLMQKQSNTADYIKYVEDVEAEINKSIVDSGATTKTMLLAYNPKSPNSIDLDCLSTMTMQYTDVINILRLPFVMPVDRVARERGGMYTGLEIAKIMEIDPEVIVIDTYNLAGSNISAEEYKAIVTEKVEYFKETNAYKNNKIIVTAFEILGGTAGISILPLIGTYIWGDDTFSEEKGWDYINYYYRNFTNMGKDVDMREKIGYPPEVYGATI